MRILFLLIVLVCTTSCDGLDIKIKKYNLFEIPALDNQTPPWGLPPVEPPVVPPVTPPVAPPDSIDTGANGVLDINSYANTRGCRVERDHKW